MTEPINDAAGKRLHFDPTINAGHILTFIIAAAAVAGVWTTLDKRVVVLEEARNYQRERDLGQDKDIGAQLLEIKATLRDVRNGVDEMNRNTPVRRQQP